MSPCQDASFCKIFEDGNGAEVLVAVVADGAGSACYSQEGATLTCEGFLDAISEALELGATVADLDERFIANLLSTIRSSIAALAATAETTSRDYACTLVGAIVGPDTALFYQVGDGAMVIGDTSGEAYECVFWPQAGEYANHTYFVTDADAADHLKVRTIPMQINEVALFSDGLQRLALHFATESAHAPFFRPVFRPVRTAPPGYARELSIALADYLSSARVCDNTDDDKSLILATRGTLSV